MSLNVGKTLLVRLDRIGDLVLTLPIDESLRKIDPNAEIQWWIPKGLGFIAANAKPSRKVLEIELVFDRTRFKELLAELRREKPKMAIVFHAPWWVSLLLFLARVPVRAGPSSQWHQFLFLNRRIRQKRSQAEFHELEYNFQLAEGALKLGKGWLPRGHLKLQGPESSLLEKYGLETGRYVVVHPGMAGSALNWPLTHYSQLISRLTQANTRVVITGTRTDEPMLKPIRQLLQNNVNITWLDGVLAGPDLIMILKNAKAVVAPSTGVLHLAASCGTPTIGLFSPVKVQSQTRWGPRGEKTQVLSPPDVTCPGQFQCLGNRCKFFDCMQRISIDAVFASIGFLTQPPKPPTAISGSSQNSIR